MLKISWIKLISGLFVLIVTISGGAFTVCKFAKDGEVTEYKLRIESLERRVQELEKRLELCLKASDRQIINEQPKEKTYFINATYVKITEPKSGNLAEKYIAVRFSVQGDLPANVKPLLVVRDPLGQWWSWGNSTTGVYKKVQLGVDKDSGESFEVRILLTDEVFERDKPQPGLPGSIASDSVIVIRK